MTTALYLAHLNPVTNAHVDIIRDLMTQATRVKVMPVVFFDRERELGSRSFPFPYDVRYRMLRAVFGDEIDISPDYSFTAPFKRYLLTPRSWSLRRRIIHDVEGDYFSYTGDRAEAFMLRLFGLRPRVGQRRALSATSVKEGMYDAVSGGDDDWVSNVPKPVADIVRQEWDTVVQFAASNDDTMRVLGMKFPRTGW